MSASAAPMAAAFLADVIANPGEDALRLIHADWLDEHGQADRAEFIRAQCELARNFVADEVPNPARVSVPGGKAAQAYARETYRRWRALCDREWSLHSSGVGGWLGPFAPLFRTSHLRTAGGEDHEGSWCVWRRGFVAEVALPCVAWLRHGPALVRAAPLETVRLTDRAPRRVDGERGRHFWSEVDFPAALFSSLASRDVPPQAHPHWKRFPSRDAADRALSASCLSWARATPPEHHRP